MKISIIRELFTGTFLCGEKRKRVNTFHIKPAKITKYSAKTILNYIDFRLFSPLHIKQTYI